MIYVVYFQKDEVLLNRIGEQELQHYARLRDFVPLLRKKGQVVEVEGPGEQVEGVYRFAHYLGEKVVCLAFSGPDLAYQQLQCPKALFPDSIPPPVWDHYHPLGNDKSDTPTVTTRGGLIDSHMDKLQPKSVAHLMPWRRSLQASWSALKKKDFRLALYYLMRRKSVHYYPTDLSLSGVVYTALLSATCATTVWKRLFEGFCAVFQDQPKTTLVIKLVGAVNEAMNKAAIRWLKTQTFQCRIILINEHLPQQQYENLIRNTTFFVQAGTTEKLGKAVLEFMSAGKPVIASKGNNHLPLDQDNAFLITAEEDDFKAALHQSYRLFQDEPLGYRAMADSASQRMSKYSSLAVVEPMLNAWLDQLEEEHSSADQIPTD